VWKDKLFGAALLAAPLFWAGVWIWGGKSDLTWPSLAPGKFVMLALVYPVLEELAFRGFLQEALYKTAQGKKTWLGISGANALTSVIFALFHLLRHPPLWAASIIFPSLVFGFFRDRYERVTPAIVLHVFYNAGYFWLFGSAA